MSRPVILCVDDERIILSSLKAQLLNNLQSTFRIELAESAEEALEIVADLIQQHIELPVVIADQIMPGMKGDELLAKIKELMPQTLTIMLTGQATADAVGKAVNKAGLFRYLSKPWDEDDLILTVQSALDTYSHQKKLIKQTHYQSVINQILLLALKPILFAEQIQEALERLVSVPCFSPPSEGVIYFQSKSHLFEGKSDARDQDQAPSIGKNTDQPTHTVFRKLAAISLQDEFAEEIVLNTEQQTLDLHFVAQTDSSFAKSYYLCPVRAEDQLIGLLYVFLSEKHQHTEQIESFLSSFCHSLSGMFRLSASNFALNQTNQALEEHQQTLQEQVKAQTEKLYQSLKQLEEKNQLLIQANNDLAYYATTDSLTDLANRRSFFDRANKQMASLSQQGKFACIAMLDLDYFKHINDENGHQAGDTVLKKIALTLRNSLDDSCIIGRVGGEEFAIFLPERTLEQAEALCSNLLEKIAGTDIQIQSGLISITGSIGLSDIKPDETSIEKAINRADQALYESKHKGRNTLCTVSALPSESENNACS